MALRVMQISLPQDLDQDLHELLEDRDILMGERGLLA